MSLQKLLPIALCAAPLAAQFDFDLEKRSSARLGDLLSLEILGAPGTVPLLLVPSTTAGPTPLSLVNPGDPRSLSVGIDLLNVTSVLISDATGTATFSTPLPNTPTLSGIKFHWQAVELQFGANLVGTLSNDIVTLTGSPDTGVLSPSLLELSLIHI